MAACLQFSFLGSSGHIYSFDPVASDSVRDLRPAALAIIDSF